MPSDGPSCGATRMSPNYPGYAVNGASVVIMYTMDQVVYIANTGDAMAVLSKNGTASLATTKHHAWNRRGPARAIRG